MANGNEDVPDGGLDGWLAAIVQSSQDAIIGKSLNGSILTWNSGAERLYGWSADEAVGQSVALLVPEHQRAFEDELFRRIAAGEQLQRVVVQRRHKSGLMIDVSLSMSPIMGPTGAVIGIASSTRDAGEGRRAEANRQRILDAAPDAMVCVDDSGAISFVNARAATLFQYRRDELIGCPIELLIAEHVREEHAWERARFLVGDYPRPMVTSQQLYGQRRDGSIFPADIGLSRLEIPGDSVLIEAVRDVSERFEIEAALRESEERFRQLATNLEVGVSLRQLEPSEFLYVSPGYRAILGLPPDAEMPTPLELGEMVHPEDRERVWAAFGRGSVGTAAVSAEHRVITPSGEVRWVRSTSSPVTVNGTVTRAAGTLEDIGARKEAEEAMLAAQREGEAANAAKSEFLSRMSHELRTPLNAVLGFAQLLELDSLSESQRSAVSHILRGGRHLLEMINDVLDISRIETDQLELSMESVLMADVLADTIGLMRPTAVNAQVEIRYAPSAEGEVYIRADRRRLRQVILNLLSNAIKYNVRGGYLEVAYEVTDEAQVRLRVSDTGIGIRSADLSRLFVPFDRFGDRTAEIEGTGIGLALSQRLVSIMGGRLEVESELGVGSTFAVVLPAADSPHARLTARGTRPTRDVAHEVSASTLLYIEDNMSNVRLIERILERRPGWTMVHAGLGGLGLELVEAARPTLVLLDLHLPDMDGVDVLRTLRADPRTADLPVVVVSADANLHQISRLHSAGAEHYLTKPLDVAEVLRVLDLHAGEPGATPPPPPPASKNKVLYIEDDEGNIRLVQRIVQLRPDLELVIAGTGEEGLRVAGDDAFSLILLDRRLPDMAGNDVLRRLKTMASAQTPVVMLSGDSGREHVEEMLDLGAVEYLAKPFDLNDLLSILDRFCTTAS